MNWLKKQSVIPRWKFILWSITCILYGCWIVLMGEHKYIYLGAFLILGGKWQTLFEKDE